MPSKWHLNQVKYESPSILRHNPSPTVNLWNQASFQTRQASKMCQARHRIDTSIPKGRNRKKGKEGKSQANSKSSKVNFPRILKSRNNPFWFSTLPYPLPFVALLAGGVGGWRGKGEMWEGESRLQDSAEWSPSHGSRGHSWSSGFVWRPEAICPVETEVEALRISKSFFPLLGERYTFTTK